jgi:ATP/ADP translocase
MSDNHTGPVETGAPMDYPEHEKTYNGFLTVAKFGTAACVALLIAMAAGFFTAGGWFGGLITFIIVMIASVVFLR